MHRLATAAVAAAFVLQPLSAFAGCSVFEHRDFGGAEWYLAGGETLIGVNGEDKSCTHPVDESCDTFYRAGWNDVISSFTVSSGCEIILWEHISQGGAYFQRYGSKRVKYVGSDWNDVASEVECHCNGY